MQRWCLLGAASILAFFAPAAAPPSPGVARFCSAMVPLFVMELFCSRTRGCIRNLGFRYISVRDLIDVSVGKCFSGVYDASGCVQGPLSTPQRSKEQVQQLRKASFAAAEN